VKLRGRQPKPMFRWITDVSNVSLTAYNEWRYVERFKEKAEEYGIDIKQVSVLRLRKRNKEVKSTN
jgi:hypothetical protein